MKEITGKELDRLIEKVISQIQYDLGVKDVTAIEELLRSCPIIALENFLEGDDA
jgi:hypothetical protein